VHDQIANAYGPNGARLREIEQRLDLDDVFSSELVSAALSVDSAAGGRVPA